MRHASNRLSGLLLIALAAVGIATALELAVGVATAQELEVINQDQLSSSQLGSSLVDPELMQPVGFHGAPDWVRGYPGWYATADVYLLHRSRSRNVVISVDDNGTLLDLSDDTTLVSGHSLPFPDFETGYRIQLGRSLGNGLALEGQYFQVSEWDSQAMATTNGLLSGDPNAEAISVPLPIDAGPFSQAVQQISKYESDLQGAEMNVRATWRRSHFLRSELVGFRYVQLREDFELSSQDETTSTPTDGFAFYDIRTDNDLFGVHVGEEIGFTILQRLCVSTQFKAGAFINAATQRTSVVHNTVEIVNIRQHQTDVALVGELNVNATLKLTGMLSVRAGYNFLWMDGLALAPEQDFPNGIVGRVDLNNNGGLFMHGFNVGLELVR